jgi:hypothetical protein
MQIAKAKNLIMHLLSLAALTMTKKPLLDHSCLSIIILIPAIVACAPLS